MGLPAPVEPSGPVLVPTFFRGVFVMDDRQKQAWIIVGGIVVVVVVLGSLFTQVMATR